MRIRRLDEHTETRLKRWTSRRPKFALMGEFSAGKSTLLNFILGDDYCPTKITATHLPAIWLTNADEPSDALAISVDRSRKQIENPILDAEQLAGLALLCIKLNRPGLSQFDIIDTPGISDPSLLTDNLALVAGYCDFVLWCTHATQAWRQSEHAAWSRLPKRLRKNSILVVTRTDKLNSENDVLRVKRRLFKETKGLFRAIVMLSTPQAAMAHRNPGHPDHDRLWVTSGGEAFVAAMSKSLLNVRQRRETKLMEKISTMLPAADSRGMRKFFSMRKQPSPATPSPKPASVVKAFVEPSITPQQSELVLQEGTVSDVAVDLLKLWDQAFTETNALKSVATEPAKLHHYLDATSRLLDKLKNINDIDEALFAYWQRLLNVPLQENARVEKALNQIRAELVDFKYDSWCNLG